MSMNETVAEGRRLLDEATPGPWNLELIVWARNNLPALLDRLERWAVVIDAAAHILDNNAKMLEHLVMDTPKDQELTDRIVDQTRHAAQSMRTALNGNPTT